MEGSASYELSQTTNNIATPMVVTVGGTVVLQNGRCRGRNYGSTSNRGFVIRIEITPK